MPLASLLDEYYGKLTDYKPVNSLNPRAERVLRYYLEIDQATPSMVWKYLRRYDKDLKYKYIDKLLNKFLNLDLLVKTGKVDERNRAYEFYTLTESGLLYAFSHHFYISAPVPLVDMVNIFNAHRNFALFKITLGQILKSETIERLTNSLKMLVLAYLHSISKILEEGLTACAKLETIEARSTTLENYAALVLWQNFSFLIGYASLFERYPENFSLLSNDERYVAVAKAAHKSFTKFIKELDYKGTN